MHSDTVQILLSTYNGEEYVSEQIESILAQDYDDWTLLVRDDQSSDRTPAILKEYSEKYSDKIQLIDSEKNLGSTGSFMKLIEISTADYIMLSDQDDVWHPQKVRRSLNRLKEIEKRNKLALVYTDMEVVDKDLSTINTSFLKHHHLKSEWSKSAYSVFAQSMAAGCCMIFTGTLRDRLHPVDSKLFQHDHWLLMHAAYYGEVSFLDWNSLKYRQHDANSIGSHGVSRLYFFNKLFSISQLIKRWKYIRLHFRPSPNFFKIMFAKLNLNLKRM